MTYIHTIHSIVILGNHVYLIAQNALKGALTLPITITAQDCFTKYRERWCSPCV